MLRTNRSKAPSQGPSQDAKLLRSWLETLKGKQAHTSKGSSGAKNTDGLQSKYLPSLLGQVMPTEEIPCAAAVGHHEMLARGSVVVAWVFLLCCKHTERTRWQIRGVEAIDCGFWACGKNELNSTKISTIIFPKLCRFQLYQDVYSYISSKNLPARW